VVNRVSVFIWLLAAALLMAPARAQVVINELVAANDSSRLDENGDSSDWFEIYNTGSETVDLEGWGLSDNLRQPFKWVLHNLTIPPRGFQVIFASGKDRQPGAVAPLSPVGVTGLKLWLMADGVQTNDVMQARISGANAFVRRWLDQSGQNNHALQASDSLQPLWIKSGLGGKPALRFDGGNDVLKLARPLATNNFTLIAVFRTSVSHQIDPQSNNGVGGVSGQRYLFGAGHGGDFAAGAGLSVGNNGVSIYEHGSSYMPAPAVFSAAAPGLFDCDDDLRESRLHSGRARRPGRGWTVFGSPCGVVYDRDWRGFVWGVQWRYCGNLAV
jgi:hypothetical protein